MCFMSEIGDVVSEVLCFPQNSDPNSYTRQPRCSELTSHIRSPLASALRIWFPKEGGHLKWLLSNSQELHKKKFFLASSNIFSLSSRFFSPLNEQKAKGEEKSTQAFWFYRCLFTHDLKEEASSTAASGMRSISVKLFSLEKGKFCIWS
jgi:hypothetical protein